MNPLQSDVYPSPELASALTGVDVPLISLLYLMLSKVLLTVLHVLAVTATAMRLWIRVRYKRFFCDDGWAALALCFDVSAAVTAWTLEAPIDGPPLDLDRKAHIVSMWVNMVSFATLLWSARMSLLLSPFRILPATRQTHMVKIAIKAFCGAMWIAINATELYGCGHDVAWYQGEGAIQCILPAYISYVDCATTILFTIVILAVASWLLRTWRTGKRQKVVITTHISVYTVAFSLAIVHAVFTFPAPTFFGAVTMDVEGALELILCNTLTFVACLWRITHRGDDLEVPCERPPRKTNGTTPSPSSSATWTTVDLEYLPTCSNPTVQSRRSVNSNNSVNADSEGQSISCTSIGRSSEI